MILVTHQNPPEVLQPREQAFDFPATLVAAEFATVLRDDTLAVRFVRRDQLNACGGQFRIQRVRVIRLVANQSLWSLIGEACDQSFLTSRTSCGEAFSVWMARGRPERSATAMSFVPLPRLVFPTFAPPF
jgi:hypothetical protein